MIVTRENSQLELDKWMQNLGLATRLHGWTWTVKNVKRGCCHHLTKRFSVPVRAFKRGSDYALYYMCHEAAHALAGLNAKHGPQFMQKLIQICPPECIQYELEYKPRAAKAAGIKPSVANKK